MEKKLHDKKQMLQIKTTKNRHTAAFH